KGNWLVLADGSAPIKAEVHSFSFRVSDESRNYAVALVCVSDKISVYPHEVELYFSNVNEVRNVERTCVKAADIKYAILTGTVKVSPTIGPKPGENRVIFAGLWPQQIEDYTAFATSVLQSRKFDLISMLTDMDYKPLRFSILRDYAILRSQFNMEIDFADPKYAFAAPTASNTKLYTASDTVIDVGERIYTGVDFVSNHGQYLRLVRSSSDTVAQGVAGIPFIGLPDLPASKNNPVTQAVNEGHRGYTQIMGPVSGANGQAPVIKRSAVSMFRAPRDAVLRTPDPQRASFTFARDEVVRSNVHVGWSNSVDPLYGSARLWLFQIEESATDPVTQATNARARWRTLISRGWLSAENADKVTDFNVTPASTLQVLRGWNTDWQFSDGNSLAMYARAIFTGADDVQAITNVLYHGVIAEGVAYGDIRDYKELR
ncbi:MAG: hypothetical protein OEW08_07465, partial [Gammaproteobacteria bacterium]|nr:hypothetical protein [Gammaproteobacteria bacterium]